MVVGIKRYLDIFDAEDDMPLLKRVKLKKAEYDCLEFKETLDDISTYSFFSDRNLKLSSLFKQENGGDPTLKINLDKTKNQALYLFFQRKPYKSFAAAASTLYPKEIPPLFDYIEIKESLHPNSETLLQLRLPPDGGSAEVIWVKKGEFASGTDLMNIALDICKALKVENILLFDDSKIEIQLGSSKEINRPLEKIYLRILFAVMHGNSFYSKFGFKIQECNEWECGIDGYTYTQSVSNYAKAVLDLQKVTLEDLKTVFKTNPETIPKLERLCKIYLGNQVESTVTLQDLTKKIYIQSKDVNNQKMVNAISDLHWLVKNILSTPDKTSRGRLPDATRQHFSALKVVNSTQVFSCQPFKN